jgi:hypothetical protein
MQEDGFNLRIPPYPDYPLNFTLSSTISDINVAGRTINDLFHVWEPRSRQYALVTTRQMVKRRYDSDDDEGGKIQNVENGNFIRETPDLQPIRSRELSPNPTITNVIPISPKSHTPQRRESQNSRTKKNTQP